MPGRQQGRPLFNSSANHGGSHRKLASHKGGWQPQLDHRETRCDGPGLRDATPSTPVLEFNETDAPEVGTPLEEQRENRQSARPWQSGVRRPGVPEDRLDKRPRSEDAFIRCPALASSPERCHLRPAAGTPPQSAPLKLGPSSLSYPAGDKRTVLSARRSPSCPEIA